jgi:MFS transporter, DHA1 family, inner membrane transport protein
LDAKTEQITEQIPKPKRSLVPSLMLAYFATNIMDFLVSLFLLDVTFSFFGSKEATYVAITSQLATISGICTIIVGIASAFLTIRFRRKSILMIGSLCIPIGVIGCILAPNFLTLSIFFPLDGIGTIIIGSLSVAIAGELIPLGKRAKSIGFIVASASIASFIGSVLIRYFFATGDWKTYLTIYALPVSIAAVLVAYFGITSTPSQINSEKKKNETFYAFKLILKNKSVVGCLIGTLAFWVGWAWILFRPTFFRVIFGLPLATVALIALGNTLAFIVGSILSGHIIDKVGRKRHAILSFFIVGIAVIITVFSPDMWVAIVFSMITQFFGAMGAAGLINMTVEQVPQYRGSTMALGGIFVAVGSSIGSAIGGVILAVTGSYQMVAVGFVIFFLAAAGVFLFMTRDPCKLLNIPTKN